MLSAWFRQERLAICCVSNGRGLLRPKFIVLDDATWRTGSYALENADMSGFSLIVAWRYCCLP